MVFVRGPNDLKGLYDMMTVSRDAPSSSGCSVPIQSWMCPQAPVTDPPIAILCFPFLIPSFGIWVSEGQKERTLAVEKSAIVYHRGLYSEQTAPSHTKPSCDVDAPQCAPHCPPGPQLPPPRSLIRATWGKGSKDIAHQSIRSVIQGWDHIGEVEAHPASPTLNKDGEVLSCRELGWDSSKENDNLARR
ncbi:predicted protein [Histoplasma capsulatum H143]|uniref:Uncharacterized protein n=1 Tax=Ajellomyces capsulatus (strain H143) TaxID=544712 RepID=C6HB46_AJECH|nr:predicted protein [Histoplasma capsulatum H143]